MMKLDQLTTFVTVLSEGSMTAAADKLYLTQPAVSQQIRNLEEDLGVDLLVRGVRQIKATPQGELLYEQSKRILTLVQQAENSVKSMGAQLKGQVQIGTLNSIGLQLMSPIISRLMRFNPDLQVRADYLKGEELIKAFKKGLFDIIILPETINEFGLDLETAEKKFLLREEMWLVSSGKDTNIPPQISIKDLSQFPLVSLIEEYPGFAKNLKMRFGESGVNANSIFESSNVGTLKRVIEAGLGWGFLPAHSVKKQVRSGRMNRTHIRDFQYEFDITFYFKKNAENRTLAEAFYQAISIQERT